MNESSPKVEGACSSSGGPRKDLLVCVNSVFYGSFKLFMRFYLIKLFIYTIVGMFLLKHASVQPFIEAYCLQLAILLENLLSPLDDAIVRHGDVVLRHSYGYAIKIVKECTAFGWTLMLITGCLALPLEIVQRIKVAAIMVVLYQVMNVLRLVIIVYAKYLFSKPVFDMFHEQFLVFLMALLAVIIFYLI